MSELEKLQHAYRASMPAKKAALRQAFDALCDEEADVALATQLHLLLHRLAGSAGSYGHDGLGQQARTLAHVWRDWLEQPVETRAPAWQVCAQQTVPFAELLEAMQALVD